MPPATPSALPPRGAGSLLGGSPLPTSVQRPVLGAATSSRLRELARRPPVVSAAESRELRVLAPSRLRSYFHTRAESWGCHPAACRSPCLSPEQKPARSRAHHPTRWLPSSPFPAQTRGKKGKRKPPCAPRCSRGDPFPAALVPRQLCLAAGRAAGAARLRRAPRELLPGRAQVRLRQRRRLPDRAGQSRRSSEPVEGPPPPPHPSSPL